MTRENNEIMAKRILRRVWGLLPVLVLVAVIFGLSAMIKNKTDQLEAAKTGLRNLDAMQLAVSEIDRVVEILKKSGDQHEAVLALSSALGISEDQAAAVVHMPLASLLHFEQERLAGRIQYVERRIAAKKLDVPPDPPDVNVVALVLEPTAIRDRINLPGVVEPWVKFDIVSEVRGRVVEKMVEKGAYVNEGEIIAVLDTRDYEIAVESVRAAYQTALVSKNRIESLFEGQFASRSQLDDLIVQVDRLKAELDAAELNLERCTIRSPISGVINKVHFDRGQYINFADPVAEVMRIDKVKINVGIPESDVTAVRRVNDFHVTFDALGGRGYQARKTFLSKSGDSMARLYTLELVIDNPDEEILPDMFARVEIVKKEVDKALSIPLYAIISSNGGQIVYVVNPDGTAGLRRVKTGLQEGWMIQVTEGVDPEDQVIVVGHRRISDAQRVNVVRRVSAMDQL